MIVSFTCFDLERENKGSLQKRRELQSLSNFPEAFVHFS